MSFAILSDIHSNLEALTEANSYIEKRKDIDEIIILGDIVGYGANPNECIEMCKNISNKIILGNHDQAAVDPNVRLFFNMNAAKAIKWTEKILDEQ